MKYRLRSVLIVAVALSLCQLTLRLPENAQAQSTQTRLLDLVSIPRRPLDGSFSDVQLRKIDPATGETISSIAMAVTEAGECNLRGGNGLATSPLTEELFALLKCQRKDADSLLAVIDPFTGETKIVGDTGDRFAALAFRPDGTLFGATGNIPLSSSQGAKNPNTLYIIDTKDASAKALCKLSPNPPSGGGQTLAFTTAGVLFRATGNSQDGGGVRRLESFVDLEPKDPLTDCEATVKFPTGESYREATALVYEGADSFLLADLNDDVEGFLLRITTEGVATPIGAMSGHVAKGLAFVPGPAEICYSVRKDRGPRENRRDVAIEDLIVGPRPARLRTAKAFLVCVPGNVRFIKAE